MGVPQIIYIILITAGVVINIVKHGEAKKPYNAPETIIATIISVGLMYWGGFFG